MTSRHEGTKNGRRALWAALIIIVLTIVFGACAAANRSAVESFISRLFGPPAVNLREAYKDKPDGPTGAVAARDTAGDSGGATSMPPTPPDWSPNSQDGDT